jgi:hypothetical protein
VSVTSRLDRRSVLPRFWSTRPRLRFYTALLIACGTASLAPPSFAKPADDIQRAVAAGGSAEVSDARPDQFLRSFTAVALRVKPRDLPDYVAAAIQLRPDLSAKIVAAALSLPLTGVKLERSGPCTIIDRIVRAAVAANPKAAVAIFRAASAAAPEFRKCILAAAIAAAPDQRGALLSAEEEGGGMMAAFLNRASAAREMAMGGLGTINPANISGLGANGNVNSPEQPPAVP